MGGMVSFFAKSTYATVQLFDCINMQYGERANFELPCAIFFKISYEEILEQTVSYHSLYLLTSERKRLCRLQGFQLLMT